MIHDSERNIQRLIFKSFIAKIIKTVMHIVVILKYVSANTTVNIIYTHKAF